MKPAGFSSALPVVALALVLASCGQDPVLTNAVDDNSYSPSFEQAHSVPVATFGHASQVPDESTIDCKDTPLADLVTGEVSSFTPDGEAAGTLQPCQVPVHRGVAANGMKLRATLYVDSDLEARLLRFSGPNAGDYALPDGRKIARDGIATMTWTANNTGEFALGIDSAYHGGSGDYSLLVECLEACERSMTRYPIVLLHGMGGSDRILNLIEYYYGVQAALEEEGYEVFVTVVDPINSAYERAEQLVPQLQEILDQTGARKLNLIGHSQGGLDGRAVIATHGWGDRVASMTTIATPHHGTPLADLGVGAMDATGITLDILEPAMDLYGWLLGRGWDQNLDAPVHEMTSDYMDNVFNVDNPDDERVAYFSWNGHTCGALERDCIGEWDGEIVTPFLMPTYRLLQLLTEDPSDGLVPLSSAQWGTFLGEIPGDHLDEVGLLFGSGSRGFDHLVFFSEEGRRLFDAGF